MVVCLRWFLGLQGNWDRLHEHSRGVSHQDVVFLLSFSSLLFRGDYCHSWRIGPFVHIMEWYECAVHVSNVIVQILVVQVGLEYIGALKSLEFAEGSPNLGVFHSSLFHCCPLILCSVPVAH